jgi:uncharacterized membrane protein
MASYKHRLTKDLDAWIAAGLIGGDRRQAILDTVPDPRRLDATVALAWVGALLLGIAMITFVAANWDEMARLVRFVIVLAVFLGACAGAAWAEARGRRLACNALLTFASLAFAAAIGLTGQIFDIAGEPRTAFYLSGAAAAALGLAGRSPGAAAASIILFAAGDAQEFPWWFGAQDVDIPLAAIAAPLGALLAVRWRSAPLAQVSALGVLYAMAWVLHPFDSLDRPALLVSAALALLAVGARFLRERGRELASVFYGWFAWGALAYFAIAGGADPDTILHRASWLAASGGVIALGQYDRHGLVTAAGIVSLIGAVTVILVDLGLDLMSAAAVFFFCALAALVASFALSRKAQA